MEGGRNRCESASNFCLEYNDGGLFIVSQRFFCLAVALIRGNHGLVASCKPFCDWILRNDLGDAVTGRFGRKPRITSAA